MRSFILYSALSKLTQSHWPVFAIHHGRPFYRHLFVRAELVDCDHNEAMDRVKPMEGETFLNCVPAEES